VLEEVPKEAVEKAVMEEALEEALPSSGGLELSFQAREMLCHCIRVMVLSPFRLEELLCSGTLPPPLVL
jgi:hypothetical protein